MVLPGTREGLGGCLCIIWIQIHHTLLLWLACTFCSSLFSNGYLRNNGITTLSFCLNCQRSIIDLAMHCALGRLCVFQIKTLIMSHCLYKPLPLTRLPGSSRCTIPIVMALVQVFSVSFWTTSRDYMPNDMGDLWTPSLISVLLFC